MTNSFIHLVHWFRETLEGRCRRSPLRLVSGVTFPSKRGLSFPFSKWSLIFSIFTEVSDRDIENNDNYDDQRFGRLPVRSLIRFHLSRFPRHFSGMKRRQEEWVWTYYPLNKCVSPFCRTDSRFIDNT